MNATFNLTDNSTSRSNLLLYIYLPVGVIVPIVGFPTNLYVLWLLLRKPGLCSTSDIFYVNLASLDALCSVLQPVEVILRILSNLEKPVLHSMLLNQFAGPLFQTCICMDSYMGVLYPVMFLKFKMPRYRLGLCALVWAATAMVSFWTYYVNNEASGLKCIAGFLVVELSIMYYCSTKVIRALKQHGPGCQKVHPAKLKAHRTVRCLITMVMIHYITPVVNFLLVSNNKVSRYSLSTIVAYMFVCISSCNHPLFYLLKSRIISFMFFHKSQAHVNEPKAAVATVES
ncbi:uracil nucleotide/cysteinyl leukotriene receptor-like [Hoplias malabaricus]|uniref:uracil nucleotide/cysteinyl leukotriene receptor-like n=1 Tax=Hoplias malabaricus TaxID=27720 RepID=UPI0034627B07